MTITSPMETTEDADLLPVRGLSNFVYCPRLFYFQRVEGIFVDSQETVEGTSLHRRVDIPTPFPSDGDPPTTLRSLKLADPALGIVGVCDIASEGEDGLILVDYKRGSAHRTDEGVRIPKPWDAIQVLAQALLAEANGFNVGSASVYYASDRRRVDVPLTEDSRASTLNIISQANALAQSGVLPPPLKNSSRCDHCSIYPICLPKESLVWAEADDKDVAPRRAPMASQDTREVLVVQSFGASIGVRAGKFEIRCKDDIRREAPISQLRAIYLFGAVQLSTQAVHICLSEGIDVAYFTRAGAYVGALVGLGVTGTQARRGQYQLAADSARTLSIASRLISTKIHNQRVLLLRNGRNCKDALKQLAELKRKATAAISLDSLRGIEGLAARIYFANLQSAIKGLGFDFEGRNRRPPKDPVNALLSLGYSMLVKELTGILHSVGLDPFLGFYHVPRLGRPALALDLMEEFRPLIVDSVVLTLVNRQILGPDDFERTARGCFLKDAGRKRFWETWFQRMDTKVTHPVFGYQMEYRRMLEIQARQLWRICMGETTNYEGLTTR